jgi:hypothetical protein
MQLLKSLYICSIKKDPQQPKKKPGRPNGSQNQDKTQVELTEEL